MSEHQGQITGRHCEEPSRRLTDETCATTTAGDVHNTSHRSSVLSTSPLSLLDSEPSAKLELTERIQNQLRRGKYQCKICLTPIHRTGPLWDCANCYSIFHLGCIHTWIKKISSCPVAASTYYETENLRDHEPVLAAVPRPINCLSDTTTQPSYANTFRWSCPTCRADYSKHFLPGDNCWCGRYSNPEPNRAGLVTHCCFQPCPRKPPFAPPGDSPGIPSCNHPCTLLCHPGPCPKCTVVIEDFRCRCGKKRRSVQCSSTLEPWSCGQVCGRQLNCGEHRCNKVCHDGNCSPCGEIIDSTCLCGRETQQVPCGTARVTRCRNVCNKPFRCKRHLCPEVCHATPFLTGDSTTTSGNRAPICDRLCPRDPKVATTCPCGRHMLTENERKSRQICTDPIPTCGYNCDKLLPECRHYCQRDCHEGPCGPCLQPMRKVCRCESMEMPVPCSERHELRCQRVCNRWKRCRRHRCTVICCPDFPPGSRGDSHLCLNVCDKLLACGIHRCDEFCHIGPCPRCKVVRRPPITCACGFTVVVAPLWCGTPIPQCPVVCGKPLPCGHRCSALCHFGACPRCLAPVDRRCAGGHKIFLGVQCWLDPGRILCRSRCGKPLEECGGAHTCPRPCHAAFEKCGPCTAPCGKPRECCNHTCQAPCHPDQQFCPDVPCTALIETECSCGFRTETVKCGRNKAVTGPPCIIPCDSKCYDEKRRKQLASAFEDVQRPEDKYITDYDEDLVVWAKSNRTLVCELDHIGDEAVKCGTGYTQSLRHEQLLWVDYYLQFYWRFGTSRNKHVNDSSCHLVIQKNPSESRIPKPKLSELPLESIPDFSRLPKPAQSFIRSNVVRFGLESRFICCEDVPTDRTTSEVVRRLDAVGCQHWRLRWSATKVIQRQTRSSSSSSSKRVDDTEESGRNAKLVPSHWGLIRPQIIIEVIDERLAAVIFGILSRAVSFFGNATQQVGTPIPSSEEVVAVPDQRKRVDDPLVDDGFGEGWTTVGRKRKSK